MKTLTIILIFCFAFTAGLIAQNQPSEDTQQANVDSVKAEPEVKKKSKFMQPPAKRLNIGARGGVSMGSLGSGTSNSGYSTSARLGFNAGIYVRYNISTRLYVQPEFNYYYSAYKFTKNGIVGGSDNVNTHSIQIPILLGLTAINKNKIGLRIQTGPSIGFNVKVNDNDFADEINDNFNSTYLNWVVDGHLRIARISISGGFIAGISNYYTGAKNNTWYIGMGVSF